jgi:hypothetical protein
MTYRKQGKKPIENGGRVPMAYWSPFMAAAAAATTAARGAAASAVAPRLAEQG